MAVAAYADHADFDALVFGQQHPSTLQYVEQRINDFQQNISQTLTDAGRAFFAVVPQLFEQFNGAEALRAARMAVQRLGRAFQRDEICFLPDLVSLQNAPLTMQRWIMAEPTIRRTYHLQRCDGYSDTYVDLEPGLVGDQHYDYRRVMNGIVQEVPAENEDEEPGWKVSTYLEELRPGDMELAIDQKIPIFDSYAVALAIHWLGEDDITSASGNKL